MYVENNVICNYFNPLNYAFLKYFLLYLFSPLIKLNMPCYKICLIPHLADQAQLCKRKKIYETEKMGIPINNWVSTIMQCLYNTNTRLDPDPCIEEPVQSLSHST